MSWSPPLWRRRPLARAVRPHGRGSRGRAAGRARRRPPTRACLRHLSEGERKRVQIARALMTDPELLPAGRAGRRPRPGGREDLVARFRATRRRHRSTGAGPDHAPRRGNPAELHRRPLLRDGEVVAQGPHRDHTHRGQSVGHLRHQLVTEQFTGDGFSARSVNRNAMTGLTVDSDKARKDYGLADNQWLGWLGLARPGVPSRSRPSTCLRHARRGALAGGWPPRSAPFPAAAIIAAVVGASSGFVRPLPNQVHRSASPTAASGPPPSSGAPPTSSRPSPSTTVGPSWAAIWSAPDRRRRPGCEGPRGARRSLSMGRRRSSGSRRSPTGERTAYPEPFVPQANRSSARGGHPAPTTSDEREKNHGTRTDRPFSRSGFG